MSRILPYLQNPQNLVLKVLRVWEYPNMCDMQECAAMTTRRSRTTPETDTVSPQNGEDGSVTLLRSGEPGSETLSSRVGDEPKPSAAPSNDTIGPPIRPNDVSYMSLTEAAYWIATEGGSNEFDINDAATWKSAFSQLLNNIVAGEVAVVGRRGGGLPESVPATHFSSPELQISYPYCGQPSDFVTGGSPHLQCWGIFDEEHRCKGFDDKLFLRRLDIEWGDLRAKGADIARHWPFAEVQKVEVPRIQVQKGKPGRKPVYDWSDVRCYVFQLMDERGEFCEINIDTDGWSQADLEALVMSYLNQQPSESTVRRHVRQFVAEWRAAKPRKADKGR
jgi:hypothetical protein